MKKMRSARGESHAPAKSLHHIEVAQGAEGGHIVTHHFVNSGPGPYHDPEPHPFGPEQGEEAMSHIADTMGMKPSEHEGEEEGQEEEA